MAAYVRLRVAYAISPKVGELHPVVRQWESYLGDWTADILNNSPENIDEHWAAYGNCGVLETDRLMEG